MMKWISKKAQLFKFEKPGDYIEGQIKAIKQTDLGKSYDIVTPDGKLFYFFGTKTLDSQITDDCQDKVCKIIYHGDIKTKGGREMKNFEVLVLEEVDEDDVD